MIKGRFNEQGQAVLDGLLTFRPIARLDSEERQINVEFVIDTGADRSVVLRDDYYPYLYSDFADYQEYDAGGFGGEFLVREVPIRSLEFRLMDGGFMKMPTQRIEIGKDQPEFDGLALPSVLGRSMTNRFKLTIDPSANLVLLEPPRGSGP